MVSITHVLSKKETYTEKTVHDCKSLMKQRLGLTDADFDRIYKIDLSEKIDVDNPVCKKYEKLNTGEIIMDLKANVVSTGPDGEELNDGRCVLPVNLLGTIYPDISLNTTVEDSGNQMCKIYKESGEPYIVGTNILNRYGQHDNPLQYVRLKDANRDDNVYWGCTLDPSDPNFNNIISELYYIKNKGFFNQLRSEATTCFRHEQDKVEFTNKLNMEILRKNQEQTRTNNMREWNLQEQEKLRSQMKQTKDAKDEYDLSIREHQDAKTKFESTRDWVSQRQGLSYKMYVGYFNDDVSFFNRNQNAVYVSSTISDIYSTRAFPLYRGDYLSIELKGYFKPSSSGRYTFYVTSDDAAYLWIGNAALNGNFNTANAIVKLPGVHGAYTASGSVNLEKDGMYPIRIQHGQGHGGWDFGVAFSGPYVSTRSNGSGFYFTSDF